MLAFDGNFAGGFSGGLDGLSGPLGVLLGLLNGVLNGELGFQSSDFLFPCLLDERGSELGSKSSS